MKPSKEKHTYTGEYLTQLKVGYEVLIARHNKLTKEHQTLTKRSEVSQRLIDSLRSENAKLMERLEKQNHKVKSQLNELETEKIQLKAQIEKIESKNVEMMRLIKESENERKSEKKRLESKNESLAKQLDAENKKCGAIGTDLSQLRKTFEAKCVDNKKLKQQIKKLEEKYDTDLCDHLICKIESLEIKLRQQNQFTRMTVVDKEDFMDRLQNKVLNLKEERYLLNGIVKSFLKDEAVVIKNESRIGKDIPPECVELLKKLAALKEKRRNGEEESDEDVEWVDSNGSGVGLGSK